MPPKNTEREVTGTKRARPLDTNADEGAVKTSGRPGTPTEAAAASGPATKRVRISDSLETLDTESATTLEAAAATAGKSKEVKDTAPANRNGNSENESSRYESSEDDESSGDENKKPGFLDAESMFYGKYDLYGMELPFLNSQYAPKAGGEVNPEALYRTILKYQAKGSRTIKVTIPYSFKFHNEGKLHSGVFCEPFGDEPYEISISNFKHRKGLIYTSKYDRPDDEWNGPSIEGALCVIDGGCGVASSSGQIKMQPLWEHVDDEGKLMELFEGIVTFRVSYDDMFCGKGFGSGQNYSIPFWAVRDNTL